MYENECRSHLEQMVVERIRANKEIKTHILSSFNCSYKMKTHSSLTSKCPSRYVRSHIRTVHLIFVMVWHLALGNENLQNLKFAEDEKLIRFIFSERYCLKLWTLNFKMCNSVKTVGHLSTKMTIDRLSNIWK